MSRTKPSFHSKQQRKLAGVTLMVIMITGGMTFAIPGMVPVAHAANPNLFVSAENSQFNNHMVGPQVIEVVINDSNIHDTDDANGEPDVTINGKILRMAQAVDGQWYGYFADRTQARIADSTTTVPGSGLDFGKICESDASTIVTGVDMGDAVGFALSATNCNGAPGSNVENNNVLREAKNLNANRRGNPEGGAGQIGVLANAWPFIQLYDLNPTGNVNIVYNKGGGAQSTVLTFDTVDDFAGLELNRQTYSLGSQVHATITDVWLNIDPTDEDSWTFATDTGSPYYQVFDENGRSGGTAINIDRHLRSLMCSDNCKLLVNTNEQDRMNPVLTVQDNDDSVIGGSDTNDASTFVILDDAGNPRNGAELGAGSVPVTITESGPATGVFGTYDESDVSSLAITTNAQRGVSGSIDYNEKSMSVLTGFTSATINIQPIDDEWNSGEEIPFVLVDEDQNRNNRISEDLDLNNPDVTLIPAISIGDPFTLGEGDDDLNAAYYAGGNPVASATVKVDDFSEIGRIALNEGETAETNSNLLVIDLETTARELRKTIIDDTDFHGFNLLNYDIRSLDQSGVRMLLVQNDGEIFNEDGTLADTVQYLQLHAGNSDQDLVILNPLAESTWFETLNLPRLPTIQDIVNNGTSGTSIPHDLQVSGVPSGYSFLSAAPSANLSIQSVTASGAESNGTVIITFGLPDVSSTTEISGDLDVRYSNGATNLDIAVPVTITVAPAVSPPTIQNIVNNGTGGTSIPHDLQVTNIPSGYSFLSAAPDSTLSTANVTASGAESNGTVTVTFGLPAVSNSTEITGDLDVQYTDGTANLDIVVPVTLTVAPAASASAIPTIQNIVNNGTSGTSITHDLQVSGVPSDYSFLSAAPDSTLSTANVTASGAESGGTVTVTFDLPTISTATTITGNLDVRYTDGTTNLDIVVPVTITVAPTASASAIPTIQDITLDGTSGTSITHDLQTSNIPSGYSFLSAAPDSTLSTANVTASGAESGGAVTITFDLPTVDSSTTITGNLDVRYTDGTTNLDIVVPVTITVAPVPSTPTLTIQDITLDGTSGTSIPHALQVSGVPSGYSFLSATPDSTLSTANVTASGAESNGTVTITFDLPTVDSSTTITGNLDVRYTDGTTNLDVVVPVTITVAPAVSAIPTIQDIVNSGTSGTSITHTLQVTDIPDGYSFLSADPATNLSDQSVTASGAESNGTVTITFGLPTVRNSTEITGNLDVIYSNGTDNLDVVVSVTLTVNPVAAPMFQDITITGTGGTTVNTTLPVTPTDFTITGAINSRGTAFDLAGGTVSTTNLSDPITIAFDLPTVSRTMTYTETITVSYQLDGVGFAPTIEATIIVNPEPRANPIGATVDDTLYPLADGVVITEIAVNLGTAASIDDVHTIPLEDLFGEVIHEDDADLNGQTPTVSGPSRISTIIGGDRASVIVLDDLDNTFTITATLADGTTQTITIRIVSDAANTPSATVTGARDGQTPLTPILAQDVSQPTIHQIIADLIPSMTPAYAQSGTTLGDALYNTSNLADNANIGIAFMFDYGPVPKDTTPIVVDFFSFGFTDDGVQSSERIANQIIRIEAEESGDDTGTFVGSLEYIMVNQLNIMDASTYTGISPIADDPSFIVIEDLTDEDAVRVTYNDRGSNGGVTPISDQQAAPSHSGSVSLNRDTYKDSDTVVVTVKDADLNVDSDRLEIYTVVTIPEYNDGNPENDPDADDIDPDNDQVGNNRTGTLENLSFGSLGRLFDVKFDDVKWQDTGDVCDPDPENPHADDGLGSTGFTLKETGIGTGIFTGDFQIPATWCRLGATTPESITGLNIEVNYVDFRDDSGEIIEVGDSAGVHANTGSVSLDRTVYPVPFGVPSNFRFIADDDPDGRSVFPIHSSGLDDNDGLGGGEYLTSGDLTIHIRVNDSDFDVNPSGEDEIAQNVAGQNYGPVKISVLRGTSTVILGYAGGTHTHNGLIGVGPEDDTNEPDDLVLRQFGPMSEIAPDAGIYELDMTIRFTDGPADSRCPNDVIYRGVPGDAAARFNVPPNYSGEDFCILQGDTLQVEYTDPTDASGNPNTVTDSATFDLRNGVLQADKSVYIIGSDMILTLIEPDFDLDNDAAETYDLDLIEWDSDAATISMGSAGGQTAAFDPEPSGFRETGDNTGVFQVVVEIPEMLEGDSLERGEVIILEYTDWGASGSDYVGDEDSDVRWTLFTSNFGATVELDQKVYTWTDKVYITIVAPDHNFDNNSVDEIGTPNDNPIKVSTRGFDIDGYKLVETGTDTGIFTGEVILTGFSHDADGDTTTGIDGNDVISTEPSGTGPTNGFLPTDDDDGLTVSFEFSEDETIIGSALIRWNIGEVQWLEASYYATGMGIVRVIDPDMNLNPEAVDNFGVDVWSDSDAGGIELTVTETNMATGIFEGTVSFTIIDESSGNKLRVTEGDIVTAEYEDNTLPDPYTTADELDITATSLIGTVVPPLERAPASNLRIADAFGNTLDSVQIDQQVQVAADLANGQDREQAFAYLVQIQNSEGITVLLAWITGSLSSGQSLSPALSWTPDDPGVYTVTTFVWGSLDNPTALSPPISTMIRVR